MTTTERNRRCWTWQDLTAIEPDLRRAANFARSLPRDDWQCWTAIKNRIRSLVGWDARLPQLRGTAQWDCATRYLEICWQKPGRRAKLWP